MTVPADALLLTARESAELLGVHESTYFEMLKDGRLPSCVQHESSYGAGHRPTYSRLKLELWAAGIDIEGLDLDTVVRHILTARTALDGPAAPTLPPAAGWPAPQRTEAAS